MISNYVLYTVAFITTVTVTIAAAHFATAPSHEHRMPARGGTCSAHTCGALDPVSDPAYNMKNVIKQSILLEEHLAEDRKYCKDCVCKHFQHIIALVEEGMMLAGKDLHKYPLLKESHSFYETVYDSWSKNRDSEAERRKALSALRDWRKDLMHKYLLS